MPAQGTSCFRHWSSLSSYIRMNSAAGLPELFADCPENRAGDCSRAESAASAQSDPPACFKATIKVSTMSICHRLQTTSQPSRVPRNRISSSQYSSGDQPTPPCIQWWRSDRHSEYCTIPISACTCNIEIGPARRKWDSGERRGILQIVEGLFLPQRSEDSLQARRKTCAHCRAERTLAGIFPG